MSGLTLAEKQELLDLYVAAEKTVLKGQAYTIRDRTLTRANLRFIQSERRRLEQEIAALTHGGMRARRILPRDV